MSPPKPPLSDHIVLTSHPSANGDKPILIRWSAADAAERGPVIGTLTHAAHRNAIGAHAGAYSLYRARAVATGSLEKGHRPDFSLTAPAEPIVEWRALTVALLDRLAERVREALGPGAAALSLGQVLQGGTWQAGRELAREHRPDSGPPIRVASGGTLF